MKRYFKFSATHLLPKIYTKAIVLFFVIFSGPNTYGAYWIVDQSSPTASIAMAPMTERHPFVQFGAVFEHTRQAPYQCEPTFAMWKRNKSAAPGSSLGSFLSLSRLQRGLFYVSTDSTLHTWEGVEIKYANGSETSIGVTAALWERLLQEPETLEVKFKGESYSLIPDGASSALRKALEICRSKL